MREDNRMLDGDDDNPEEYDTPFPRHIAFLRHS